MFGLSKLADESQNAGLINLVGLLSTAKFTDQTKIQPRNNQQYYKEYKIGQNYEWDIH